MHQLKNQERKQAILQAWMKREKEWNKVIERKHIKFENVHWCKVEKEQVALQYLSKRDEEWYENK